MKRKSISGIVAQPTVERSERAVKLLLFNRADAYKKSKTFPLKRADRCELEIAKSQNVKLMLKGLSKIGFSLYLHLIFLEIWI